MHHGDNKITKAFNPTSVLNNNYGSIVPDTNPLMIDTLVIRTNRFFTYSAIVFYKRFLK